MIDDGDRLYKDIPTRLLLVCRTRELLYFARLVVGTSKIYTGDNNGDPWNELLDSKMSEKDAVLLVV